MTTPRGVRDSDADPGGGRFGYRRSRLSAGDLGLQLVGSVIALGLVRFVHPHDHARMPGAWLPA